MRQNTPLLCMNISRDAVVSAVSSRKTCQAIIPIAFPIVSPGAIDISEGCCSIERESVGPDADVITISLVASPMFEMPIASHCIIDIIESRDLSKERSRVLRQRV